MVPAMAPKWMPSAVVPPRTRATSLCRPRTINPRTLPGPAGPPPRRGRPG